MTVKYVSFGIIIDDIVFPDGTTHMGTLGGGGPQTAWGMALAAGDPAEVGLISGVGPDFDPALLAPMRAAGIDLTGVKTTHLPTPRAWELLEADERRTHVWRSEPTAYDIQIGLNRDLLLETYPEVEAAHWYVHPEHPNLNLSSLLHKRGALISIESARFPGMVTPEHVLRTMLAGCDIFSPNWEEAVNLFGTSDKGEMLRRGADFGGHILSLRCGPSGAEVWDLHQGKGVSVPAAPPRVVVDPVGAGNTFCGAFAVTYCRTGDLLEGAINAVVAASYLVEQIGLPPEPPMAEDVRRRGEIVRAGAQKFSL